MILVDTSVWVDYLRAGNQTLAGLLNESCVLMHPFVLGEISLGHLKTRAAILEAMSNLPMATVANDDEVMRTIEHHRLYGLGIGYIDAHLIASVQLTSKSTLWTMDRRLRSVCDKLGLVAPVSN